MGNEAADGRNQAGAGCSASQVPRKEEQAKAPYCDARPFGFPNVLPAFALPWIVFLLIGLVPVKQCKEIRVVEYI